MFNVLDRVSYTDEMKQWETERRAKISSEDKAWAEKIAESDDEALKTHDCFEGSRVYYKNFNETGLGDADWWEISLKECKHCGFKYLRVFMDSANDGRSHSGRWVIGRVPMDTKAGDIDISIARLLLANYDQVFFGGSYWGHAGKWSKKLDGYGWSSFEVYCQ